MGSNWGIGLRLDFLRPGVGAKETEGSLDLNSPGLGSDTGLPEGGIPLDI